MLKRFLLITLLLSGPGFAEELSPVFCYLPTEQNVTYTQVTELPTANPAKIIPYGADALQYGELWLPPAGLTTESSGNSSIRHPLVVLIHGGCWLNQYDIRHTHALSTALTYSGYAVWAIEYRRTGDAGGGWPGSYNDIKQAINFISQLKSYPVMTENPALVGHSAGGHLALLAAQEMADRNLVNDMQSAGIAVVIGLAAIVDIAEYSKGDNSCQTAAPKFLGGLAAERPDAYVAANPARRALHPNTILIHGDQDAIVPISQSLAHKNYSRTVKGAGHFDMIHPATPAYQQLLKELAGAFSDPATEN